MRDDDCLYRKQSTQPLWSGKYCEMIGGDKLPEADIHSAFESSHWHLKGRSDGVSSGTLPTILAMCPLNCTTIEAKADNKRGRSHSFLLLFSLHMRAVTELLSISPLQLQLQTIGDPINEIDQKQLL